MDRRARKTAVRKTKTCSRGHVYEGSGTCPVCWPGRLKKKADWRAETMTRIRTLIKQADPQMVEEVKWKKPSNPSGIPVWYHDGMICTGETYKNHLRLTFAKGASLKDPKGLINSYRAMLIREGDTLSAVAFKSLIREAVALNVKGKSKKK